MSGRIVYKEFRSVYNKRALFQRHINGNVGQLRLEPLREFGAIFVIERDFVPVHRDFDAAFGEERGGVKVVGMAVGVDDVFDVLALYAVLAHCGYFPLGDLKKYCNNGTYYQGHSRRDFVPGIEVSAGSLGHGLNMGTGMAWANMKDGNPGRIYVLLGDGECNEGSVWEAALFAAKWHLSNLIAIVDRNHLQSYDKDEDALDMGDMAMKFKAFGWNAVDIDGHNYEAIESALGIASNKPLAVIADTIKGKGISFMENKKEWHFLHPEKEDYEKGMEELNHA
jgi:transketolase